MFRTANLDSISKYITRFVGRSGTGPHSLHRNNNTKRFAQRFHQIISIINRNLHKYILLFGHSLLSIRLGSVCFTQYKSDEHENVYFLIRFRMDICRCTVLSANEPISFRWIIVVMIYMSTIILCLSSESFDERFYEFTNVNTNNNSTSTMDMVRKIMQNIIMQNIYRSI